ncbi:hypothetical protein [Anthocerotibacter panamensis]|uniref:hypothetical protein n=1 Tax=Anthocerotibacter panamensis TaxID=2857077 RepID=UPI001C408A90|nr:hypothetical protein [Anthocerotibacter panamensis]
MLEPTEAEVAALAAQFLADEARTFSIDQQQVQARFAAFPRAYEAVRAFQHACLGREDPRLLWDLWLPLALEARTGCTAQGALMVGLLGAQGTGKSTLGQALCLILAGLGLKAVTVSLDDFYQTRSERATLRQTEPGFSWRGPPGTHDLALADSVLNALAAGGTGVWVPGFDKGAYGGVGERFNWVDLQPGMRLWGQVQNQTLTLVHLEHDGVPLPLPDSGVGVPVADLPVALTEGMSFTLTVAGSEAHWDLGTIHTVNRRTLPVGWRWVSGPVDVVFFEGWFVGCSPVAEEVLAGAPWPIVTEADQAWALRVNRELAHYLPLWNYLDRLWVLHPTDFRLSRLWRAQAEQRLREQGHGGMSETEVDAFVEYFWKSLHPELFISPLLERASLVMQLGADRQVLRPFVVNALLAPRPAPQCLSDGFVD